MQKRPNIVMLMFGERLTRLGFVVGVTLAAAVGCSVGSPENSSDIQNVNGISDDISAVGMTQSDSLEDFRSEFGDNLSAQLSAGRLGKIRFPMQAVGGSCGRKG